VHFLDNVVDCSNHPLAEIGAVTRANRKIGLGLMGFADALAKLGIPYDSDQGVAFGEQVMRFLNEKSHAASVELAKRRGSFPNFKGSLWEQRGYSCMRNAAVTTIAPTGTISMIAGVSSGIEPIFALSFFRNVLGGAKLMEENDLFQRGAHDRGFYSRELMTEIARRGSARGMHDVPEDVQRVFVTAFDVEPTWHVRMQAAFQRHCDSSVSKTVNLPSTATQADVRRVYLLAYALQCKGITIYRYGTIPNQVLQITSAAEQAQRPTSTEAVDPALSDYAEFLTADAEFSGQCRECAT
jgi:ribonucleoside-diphosphate reductase alpha chain